MDNRKFAFDTVRSVCSLVLSLNQPNPIKPMWHHTAGAILDLAAKERKAKAKLTKAIDAFIKTSLRLARLADKIK